MLRQSRRLMLSVTLVSMLAIATTAVVAAAIIQVDPSTVPSGFLVAGSRVTTPIHLKVGDGRTRVLPDGSQVYVQHASIQPGASTGWHTHAGPVIVTMVGGALTLYDGDDPTCAGTTYAAGSGFVDEGFGHVHIARNEGKVAAEFYATYILPPGSGDAGVKNPLPTFSNPACGF